MTQVKNKLGIIILLFMILGSIQLSSQNEIRERKIFVRVFDFEDKKIAKGYLRVVTDSTLELSRSSEYLSIPLKNINYIKTKRSTGSNALIGSITGATIIGILGIATADPDAWLFGYSAAEGALAGGLIGAIGGGVIGGITSIFKNSKTIYIEGDSMKWNFFKKMVEKIN